MSAQQVNGESIPKASVPDRVAHRPPQNWFGKGLSELGGCPRSSRQGPRRVDDGKPAPSAGLLQLGQSSLRSLSDAPQFGDLLLVRPGGGTAAIAATPARLPSLCDADMSSAPTGASSVGHLLLLPMSKAVVQGQEPSAASGRPPSSSRPISARSWPRASN